MPMSVKLFGVVKTYPSFAYHLHKSILSLVDLAIEMSLDMHSSLIGRMKKATPSRVVVETRSLISQLELRKPQENPLRTPSSQKFPSEGEHTDSQPCLLAASCFLVRDLLCKYPLVSSLRFS